MSQRTFAKGDIVRVQYASPVSIERWMNGEISVGPGDVGVVKFNTNIMVFTGVVTVMFPMVGTFGVHSSNLVLVQQAEENSEIQSKSS